MYEFNPLSDEQINDLGLVDEGQYNFQVIKSVRKMSKSMNPMSELQLQIWDKEGKTHIIYDYLVFSSVPLNIKKVKHFCESTGLQEQYKKGAIQEELERLSGTLHLGIKPEQAKGDGTFYPKKNHVIDYLPHDMKATQNPISQDKGEFKDDDLPF